MFPQYWSTKPTSPFEQTLFEADQVFYATFPAARDAVHNAALEQSLYDPPTDCPTSYEAAQPLGYNICNELESFGGPIRELSTHTQLHFDYSNGPHPQQPFLSHQGQSSYYSPPHPIENKAPVYIPTNQSYHPRYSSEPMSYISHSHPNPFPPREPTFRVYQPSNISSQVNTDIQETVNDGRPESPRYDFCQLNRHMKPPTLKFTNNCQLGVMRLDRLSDPVYPDSPIHSGPSHPNPSETSHASSSQTTPSTEFLLSLAKSPSIGLSSLPSKNIPEKKPTLTCLFCRGRKIACGPPLPGSTKTCKQCWKRGLQCHYPTESRRGMRRKKPRNGDQDADTKVKKKKKSQK